MPHQGELMDRDWFYEFELPDGTKTKSCCPDAVRPHVIFRRDVLLDVIDKHFGDQVGSLSALDIGSHEGYYTIELAKRFRKVQAVEKNEDTATASKMLFDTFCFKNIELLNDDFLEIENSRLRTADFVLLYGVIYHLENPVGLLRKAASMVSRILLIETQILNFDIDAKIDWGNYESQKSVHGIFGVVRDDPEAREGGITDVALVPSLNSLRTILGTLGFSTILKIPVPDQKAEQLFRDRRAILLCIR